MYVVGNHEVFLMSTYNICFYGEMGENYPRIILLYKFSGSVTYGMLTLLSIKWLYVIIILTYRTGTDQDQPLHPYSIISLIRVYADH